MANSDDNPIRLATPGDYRRAPLPTKDVIVLPSPRYLSTSFVQVLAARRSAKTLGPVTISDLGDWLFFTASTQTINLEDSNRQRRFVASFGALHPAHILLGFPDGLWFAYCPLKHCVGLLSIDERVSEQLRSKARLHCDCPDATLVALLADYDLVCNYYEHAHGLLLKDAGVLLGHAQIVAAALGLGFRILGSTGAPELEQLVSGLTFRTVATGLAWIGAVGHEDHRTDL